MANFSSKNLKRKRPKIRTQRTGYLNNDKTEKIILNEEVVESVQPIDEIIENVTEETVEEVVEVVATEETVEETTKEIVTEETVEETTEEEVEETVAEITEEVVVEETVEETAEEEVEETVAETTEEVVAEETVEEEICDESVAEDVDEVPLEMSEDEEQIVLDEEASLDGTSEEVLETIEEVVSEETVEDTTEEVVAEEIVEETTEEVIAKETVEETTEEVVAEEAVEETAEEVAVTETAEIEESDESEDIEEEEKEVEKPKKEEFMLTPPENLDDILANICTKRARKLIYRPNDVLFSLNNITVIGTDKNNDEKIKVKNILDAEIKQGVKLGYLDKFDGLKMSELKEEYENDIVYEYADQEFKRTGILLDGDKVKVYVYDWDMKACHHVGCIDDESAEKVKPYILDREKYSFDINGIIVGGKYKKIIKDEKTGKITVEKGNDGNLGMEIDINIINRKD